MGATGVVTAVVVIEAGDATSLPEQNFSSIEPCSIQTKEVLNDFNTSFLF